MNERMRADLVCDALKSAYWRRKPAPGLILHSDRGSQYARDRHRQLIADFGMAADEGVPQDLVTAMAADEGVPQNLVTAMAAGEGSPFKLQLALRTQEGAPLDLATLEPWRG